MATDRVETQIRCPACDTPLTIPTRVRYRRGAAVLAIDTSEVRQHIAEHETRDHTRQ